MSSVNEKTHGQKSLQKIDQYIEVPKRLYIFILIYIIYTEYSKVIGSHKQ